MTNKNKFPLFPLNQVILPGELLPLHIFEDRYIKMVNNSLDSNEEFGIVYMKNDIIEKVGCSAAIKKVIKKYENGKYDILCKGQKRFQINKLYKFRSAWYGDITFLDKQHEKKDNEYFDKTLDKYLKFLLSINVETNLKNELNKKEAYDFMRNILLPLEIKQRMLNLDNEKKRLDFINNFIDLAVSSLGSKAKNKNTIEFN
tara:strand:+ start:198 stop:800 length:603 start_codon:yes stop_codon:yes gene_type:complete